MTSNVNPLSLSIPELLTHTEQTEILYTFSIGADRVVAIGTIAPSRPRNWMLKQSEALAIYVHYFG